MVKALAAALVLTLVYVGLDSTDVLPQSLSMRARTATEPAIEASEQMARVDPAEARSVALEAEKNSRPQRSAVAVPIEAGAASNPSRNADAGVWLSARFVDDQGRPVAGVALAVDGVETQEQSDVEGKLRAKLEGAPEEMNFWTVRFVREGYATHQEREKREPGVDLEFGEIVMEPGGSIRGRVVDDLGRSVAGARIDFMTGVFLPRELEAMRFRYHRGSAVFAETDETGAFFLEGISPGSIRLWAVTKRDYLPSFSEAIEVRAGRTESGVLLTMTPLPPEHRIQLRVYGPEGEPAADARVDYSHYSASEGDTVQSTRFTDEEGRLEFAVFADVVLTGQAVDAEETCSPALIGPLTTGLEEARIDLTQKQYSHFSVRDGEGNGVNEFSYEVRSAGGETVLHSEEAKIYLAGSDPPTFVEPSAPY
ncbi:MAG: carboxypeptidase-like regulatory domain-containing protein, partial [Planctomycetota bacterium]